MRRIAYKTYDAWRFVNLTVVDETTIELAGVGEELWSSQRGKVGNSACGAQLAFAVPYPVLLEMPPSEDDQQRYRLAWGVDLSDDGVILSAARLLGPALFLL